MLLRIWLVSALALFLPATAAANAPVNDTPANATSIVALPANVSGSTFAATMDPDEPAPLVADSAGLDRSVWFSYVADRDRRILADTCDANFDNHIDVYAGPIGALAPIATTSDDYSGCPGERRTFALTGGTMAFIRVTATRPSDHISEGGVFHLSLNAQEPPANDAFNRALQLAGPGAYTAGLAFSTIEFGEPSGGGDTGSVWFRLVAPRSEPYTVQLADNPFGASLIVFESLGATINRLRPVTGTRTAASFNALQNHRYYVRVSTSAAVAGDVRMDVTTNTARGIGLLVTPARNTLSSVRRNGLRAVLSCARTCALHVELLLSHREALRLKLVDRKAKGHAALRIGRIGGVLQTGQATTVSIPITARRVRQALAHARSVRFTLDVTVRGATRAQSVQRTVTIRR